MPNLLRSKYRTKDGTFDYQFLFEEQMNGTWLAYIERQPPYRGRSEGANETHRLTSSDGRKYICWTNPPQSLEGMRTVAALWADSTQTYIRTGVFPT